MTTRVDVSPADRADLERLKAAYDKANSDNAAANLEQYDEQRFRPGNRSYSAVIRDGEVIEERRGYASTTSTDVRGPATGVLATATSQWGSPQAASAVKPESLVTVDGMTTTAEVAERMGFLVRDPSTGIYRETAVNPQ